MEKGLTYKDAGVDIDAGNRAVDLIKKHVRKTMGPEVLTDIGGFGGLFAPNLAGIAEPVLVAGADGVGTKLHIAFELNKHDTIGIDCVAMCVNDIVAQGASPLFFLDYIATGKVHPEKIEAIVSGVAKGCIEGGCALLGGETAEMPGLYKEEEYDIAGFAVGIVDKAKLITGSGILKGDVVIGIPSSGIHSNGYSLVRKVFKEIYPIQLDQYIPELSKTLGEELLTPTRMYTKILRVLKGIDIKGIAHITGGGWWENIPRILPKEVNALLDAKHVQKPYIFNMIEGLGGISVHEMYRTFNMGIGFVLVVGEDKATEVMMILKENNEEPAILGEIVEGQGEVILKGCV